MGNPLSDLWNSLKSWKDQNAKHYVYVRVNADHTDVPGESAALQPYQSYFRLFLKEMYLTKSRAWFTDWYPAVTSLIQLKFADREGVRLSSVAQPPEGQLSEGIFVNYRLSELLPYNGGVVEVDAGLMALKGANHLAPAIKILQSFSGLIAAPLAPVLPIAEKVAAGVQELMDATNGQVHLSLHDTFTADGGGGTTMRPGYFAVVLASEDDVKASQLSVRDSRLYRAVNGGQAKPLTGYDYLLFYLEGRIERDDWRLKNIQEPLEGAVAAYATGEQEKGDTLRKVALLAAFTSPDLTVADRKRVALAIKQELDEAKSLGLGATGGEPRELKEVMAARAISRAQAANTPDISLDELFAAK
jgi:hypothetical protein